jgi:hypothetical protein
MRKRRALKSQARRATARRSRDVFFSSPSQQLSFEDQLALEDLLTRRDLLGDDAVGDEARARVGSYYWRVLRARGEEVIRASEAYL